MTNNMDYDEKKYPMIWKRVSRQGYHFTARIPCRVLSRIRTRFRIAALLVDGSELQHIVKAESLEHDPCLCFSRCRALENMPCTVKD